MGALLHVPGWGVALLDRELRPRWVNDALASLSGVPASQYGTLSLLEAWPGLAPQLAQLVAHVRAGESVVDAPLFGTFRGVPGLDPLQLRVTLLPAVTGGVLAGLTLVLRDETPRLREERTVREREALLAGLAEVSCDGYFFHEGGVVLHVNRALATLLGCTPEDMLGESIFRWVAPESREDARVFLRRGVESPYEVLGLREDGQRMPLEVLGRVVRYQGRTARLVAVWDISARKASDEATARATHFRDQLLGVVGHDLRTPLYAIQLGAAALQRSALSETQLRQLGTVVNASRRMERMIRELLDFTRARLAGGLPVQPAPLSLGDVVARAVEEQRLAWPARDIRATSEGDVRGEWDEGRLIQLLDNLLGNALQHSPKDTPVEVRLAGGPDGVTLAVHNEGPPLPSEEHAVLFEPFRRGRRAQGDGLGLGLYIARQIALAHAGRLSVESSFGRGTRFTVWLPRESPGNLG
ncbi:ATP-binding protein [Myxococcaceae bacterium GXIMD 01537]